MELTDRLQSEQHLGRENKSNVITLQEELDTIRQKLHFKDEEMIRLSHENEEIKKECLQLTIEIDRLRHYESKEQSTVVVQKQSEDLIRKLRNKICVLEASVAKANIPTDAIDGDIIVADEATPTTNGSFDNVSDDASATSVITTIATEEAMDRLQERFTRTMSDHASLTEEKYRLEHLVMQLQDETNTIGDYIALYHKQRLLLKQREIEKDVQLQHIIRDREEMQQKLVQLNSLVEQLMRQQAVTYEKAVASPQTNGNVIDLPQENGHLVEPNSTTLPTPDDSNHPQSSKTSQTATQILHLLSEIQNKNQTLDNRPLPSMEKCACCYGKLEVV